jgi:hypothetical protein
MKSRRTTGATTNSRRRRLRVESLEQLTLLSADVTGCFLIYIEPSPVVADPHAPYCHAGRVFQEVVPTESRTASVPIPDQPQAGLAPVSIAKESSVRISLEIVDAEDRQIDQLQIGDVVQLKFYAHDLRATPRGVFAVYADIEYPAVLVPVGEETLDSYFANGRSGFDDRGGLIDELGGFGGIEYPADPTRSLVATIPMRAVAVGAQPISLDAADYEDHLVLLHGWDNAVPTAQIDYLGMTVTVVERATADALTDTVDEVFEAWDVPRPVTQIDESRWEEPPTLPATPLATSTEDVAEAVSDRREPLGTRVILPVIEPVAMMYALSPTSDPTANVTPSSALSASTPPASETLGNELTFLLHNPEVSIAKFAKGGGKLRWKVR